MLEYVRLKYIVFFLLPFCSVSGFSQRSRIKNLPGYDLKPFHFGFSLGVNAMDFNIQRSDEAVKDSLFADVSMIEPGFHVLAVCDMALNDYFSLRLQPGISFGQRNISFFQNGKEIMKTKIESNYLIFPLQLRYKAKRLNSYRPYLVGGVTISYDMAAGKKPDLVKNKFLILVPFDLCYEVGGGIDFFLQNFKFTTELKLSIGTRNMFSHKVVPGFEKYTQAIDGLTSKIVVFSIFFE
jgi:hypothetical protein